MDIAQRGWHGTYGMVYMAYCGGRGVAWLTGLVLASKPGHSLEYMVRRGGQGIDMVRRGGQGI